MDIKDCANNYQKLLNKRFIFTLENQNVIEVIFQKNNFYHLLGFHKLSDINKLNINTSNNPNSIFKDIKRGVISDSLVKGSIYYYKVESRVDNFYKINNMIFNDIIVDFDSTKIGTKIKAKYILFTKELNEYFNLALGLDKNGKYYYPETFIVHNGNYYQKNQNHFKVSKLEIINPKSNIIEYTQNRRGHMRFSVSKDIDTRDNSNIHVVKFESVSKDQFFNLTKEIKAMGGYYSKFKKGFIFKDDPNKILEARYGTKYETVDIEDVKKMSIEDFCNAKGIGIKGNGRYKHLSEHDSLVIDTRNNNFHWNSQGKNGDIINFVEAYYGVDFKESIRILSGKNLESTVRKIDFNPQIELETKELNLQNLQEVKSLRNVIAYLNKTRKIDAEVIKEFINKKFISQDEKNNINFKYLDKDGNIEGFEKKGTNTFKSYQYFEPNSTIKGFRFKVGENVDSIHAIESTIDLMSYYELNKDKLNNTLLVSMGGLKHNSILENLKDYPNVKDIFLCVDNDAAGDKFHDKLIKYKNSDPTTLLGEELLIHEGLQDKNLSRITPSKKDWNEDIKELKISNQLDDTEKKLQEINQEIKHVYATKENYLEYLEFSSKFYKYSLANVIFLKIQNKSINYVDSFNRWKERGINIKQGEKGYKVFVPVKIKFFENDKGEIKKESEATPEEKKLIEEGKIQVFETTKFTQGTVFDISQTNIREEEIPKILGRTKVEVEDMELDVEKTFENFKKVLEKEGIKIEHKNLSNPDIALGTKGYTNTVDKIVLNLEDKPENKLKTLVHEVAHCKLHNKEERESRDDITKGRMEIEAESVAYITLKNIGIDSKDKSFPYIMSWNGGLNNYDDDTLKGSLKNINKAIKDILPKLESSIELKNIEKEIQPEKGLAIVEEVVRMRI